MRALLGTSKHGWFIASALSLVLLTQRGYGTIFCAELLLLVLLLGTLLFVAPRTVAVLAAAVIEVIGLAIPVSTSWVSIHVRNQRVTFPEASIRCESLQLPPPQLR